MNDEFELEQVCKSKTLSLTISAESKSLPIMAQGNARIKMIAVCAAITVLVISCVAFLALFLSALRAYPLPGTLPSFVTIHLRSSEMQDRCRNVASNSCFGFSGKTDSREAIKTMADLFEKMPDNQTYAGGSLESTTNGCVVELYWVTGRDYCRLIVEPFNHQDKKPIERFPSETITKIGTGLWIGW